MIGGRTKVFALLGNPVSHSLSPVMQNAAFRALGLDAAYVALQVSAEELPGVMRAVAAAGGGGNVTVPHKRIAATVAGTGRIPAASSCNTFWGEGSRIMGASTDGAGVLSGWAELGRPSGDWWILGTGGSAVATALAAGSVGAAVVVKSRDPERARAFEREVSALGASLSTGGQVGLVVNCTPLGMVPGDPMPLANGAVPAGAAVLDLVYRPGETAWVRAVRLAGHRAMDGRSVLLGQGMASFQCWFPKIRAPQEVMSAALDRALR